MSTAQETPKALWILEPCSHPKWLCIDPGNPSRRHNRVHLKYLLSSIGSLWPSGSQPLALLVQHRGHGPGQLEESLWASLALQSGGDILRHCHLECHILNMGISKSHLTGNQKYALYREDLNSLVLVQEQEPEVTDLHVGKQSRPGCLCTWHGGIGHFLRLEGSWTACTRQLTANKSKPWESYCFTYHCPPHGTLGSFPVHWLLTLGIYLRFYPAFALLPY